MRTELRPVAVFDSGLGGISVLAELTALRARREQPELGKPRRFPEVDGPKGMPGLSIQITAKEQLTQKLLKLETVMPKATQPSLCGTNSASETLWNLTGSS